MKRILIAVFILLSLFVYGAEPNEEVEAEGVGAIKNSDQAKARDDAIWDAQRKAVEKGIGMYISSETTVLNARVLEDSIFTQANGFVDKYVITSEKKDDMLYFVKIKAIVKKADIANKLSLMGFIKKIGDPRIMIITNGEKEIADICDSLLTERFLDDKYRLVDKSQVERVRQSEEGRKMAEGDVVAAKNIGTQLGVDIVLVSNASGKISDSVEVYGTTSKSYNGNIMIKMIRTDNGEILMAVNNTVLFPMLSDTTVLLNGYKEALRQLYDGKPKAKDKIDTIPYKIIKYMLEKRSIQVVFSGINSNDHTALIKMISNIRGVKGVYGREFSNGIGRVDVDYERPSDKLKEELERLDIPLKGISITANYVELKLLVPTVIEVSNLSYGDYNSFVNKFAEMTGVKVTKKSYASNKAKIEFTFKGDIQKIVDKYEPSYEIVEVSEEKIVMKKK